MSQQYNYLKEAYTDFFADPLHVAKLSEEKGWKAKAIEPYQKFLDLWRDADPGISEVDDAKKGVAGLKEQ